MNSSNPNPDPRVSTVSVTEDELRAELLDGRIIIVPLAWFPRLLNATQGERDNWRIIGDGEGIHWPDIDEDLSVMGLLRGTPAVGGRLTRRLS